MVIVLPRVEPVIAEPDKERYAVIRDRPETIY